MSGEKENDSVPPQRNPIEMDSPDDRAETPVSKESNRSIAREKIGSEILEEVVKHVSVIMESRFAGPLPHPSHLKGYAEINPEYADRIIQMAERAQIHKHETANIALRMQHELVQSKIANSRYGQVSARYIGLSALLVALLISVLAGSVAGPICGSLFGLGGIASLVVAYIRGTEKQQRESGETHSASATTTNGHTGSQS